MKLTPLLLLLFVMIDPLILSIVSYVHVSRIIPRADLFYRNSAFTLVCAERIRVMSLSGMNLVNHEALDVAGVVL